MSIKRFNPTCAASGHEVVVYSLVRHTRVNLGVRRRIPSLLRDCVVIVSDGALAFAISLAAYV